ncbi:TrmB family transcriptional regulator [Halosegnis sp.]|uniref:TrmB family transcriptional regulator n=1 Tax=Halosegnis sp. TaxID=2864959 RepID=UPI0035D472E5
MTDRDLRTLTERLGAGLEFGEYELAVYLTVLEHGELTAPELARRADVPKTRVYDTARDLADRGLVEVHETRPMRVAAADPEAAFAEFRDSLDDLVEAFDDRYVEPELGGEAVSLVTSRRSILRHLDAVVDAAEYELSLSIPVALLNRLAPALRELEDVHVSLLLFPQHEAPGPEAFDYNAVASLARTRRGVTTPVVAVADGRRSVYASREAAATDGDGYGVIFDDSTLGFLVYGFYQTMLWATGRTVTEQETPASFPRRYASVRRCVDDLQRLQGPFHASVEGRDVLSGDPREVAGPVVDTTLNAARGITSLTLDTDEGHVSVGGRVAAVEDVEAHRLEVERT